MDGKLGKMMDTHSTKAFMMPYKAATFTATQMYRYKCTCPDGTVREGDLMGPITIVRTITREPDGSYLYTITKNGETASGPLP